MLHMKFEVDWPSGFREEDDLKVWTTTTTTDDGACSPCEPNGSGELKNKQTKNGLFLFINEKQIIKNTQTLLWLLWLCIKSIDKATDLHYQILTLPRESPHIF